MTGNTAAPKNEASCSKGILLDNTKQCESVQFEEKKTGESRMPGVSQITDKTVFSETCIAKN